MEWDLFYYCTIIISIDLQNVLSDIVNCNMWSNVPVIMQKRTCTLLYI